MGCGGGEGVEREQVLSFQYLPCPFREKIPLRSPPVGPDQRKEVAEEKNVEGGIVGLYFGFHLYFVCLTGRSRCNSRSFP